MVDIVDVLEQARITKAELVKRKLQAAIQKKEDLDCLKGKLLSANTNANSASWEVAQVMMMGVMMLMLIMMMLMMII